MPPSAPFFFGCWPGKSYHFFISVPQKKQSEKNNNKTTYQPWLLRISGLLRIAPHSGTENNTCSQIPGSKNRSFPPKITAVATNGGTHMSRTPSTELRALWGLKGGFKVIRTSGAIEAFEPEPHQQKLRGFNAVRKHHQFFFYGWSNLLHVHEYIHNLTITIVHEG